MPDEWTALTFLLTCLYLLARPLWAEAATALHSRGRVRVLVRFTHRQSQGLQYFVTPPQPLELLAVSPGAFRKQSSPRQQKL